MLTFESTSIAGVVPIIEKLTVSPTHNWKPILNSDHFAEPPIREGQARRLYTRCPTLKRDWRYLDLGYWCTSGTHDAFFHLISAATNIN